jgi:oligopeptide transport system substrate-binding protein
VIFKKSILFLIIVVFTLVAFTGCSANTGDYILYIETDSKPNTVDPQLAESQVEEILARNMFEGLMRLDGEGNVVKGVAETVETSKNGLTYTFKIRENAVWSDGSKVVADDFLFAIQRALNPLTKAPKADFLYSIKNAKKVRAGENTDLGVYAVSDSVLKIELSDKNPNFLKVLTTSVCMPCKRAAFNASKGKYGMSEEDFISNGSYTLRSWVKDGEYSIRIVKNEEYSGSFVAHSSAVNFTVGERAERFEKLSKNNIDLGFTNYAESNDKVTVSQFSKSCYALLINPQSDLARDEFKKAISLSLNREELKKALQPSLEYTDILLPDVVLKDGKALSQLCNFKSEVGHNPIFARESFLDGVRKYGNPGDITIIYVGGDDIKSAALSVADSYQKALGIVVNIKALETEQELKEAVGNRNFQLAIMPITAQSDSVAQYFGKFGGENNLNIYGFSSKSYDELLGKTNDYMKEQELVPLAEAMLKQIDKSLIITPLFKAREAFGYSNMYVCPKISPFDGVIDFSMITK